MDRFSPGDHILLRQVWRTKPWFVRPVSVVRDTPELVALYVPPETICGWPRSEDGRRLRVPQDEWLFEDVPWAGHNLRLSVPGASHAVALFWNESWQFVSWYVDLQTPMLRTPLGFDYMDWMLDIVVAPDLAWWRWKDEDQVDEGIRRGLWDATQAAEVRVEGERALERLLARKPPFDEHWEDWRPDPSWTVPTLPPGWDIVDSLATQ